MTPDDMEVTPQQTRVDSPGSRKRHKSGKLIKTETDVVKKARPASKPGTPRQECAEPGTPRLECAEPGTPRLECAEPGTPRLECAEPETPRLECAEPGTPGLEGAETAMDNAAWGIYKSRKHFVEMHFC